MYLAIVLGGPAEGLWTSVVFCGGGWDQTLLLSSPSAPSAFAAAFFGGMLKMLLGCCVVI